VKSNPAEIGSLLIEYGTLARLTGKQEYYDKPQRALVSYTNGGPRSGWLSEIDVETGKWTDPTAGSWRHRFLLRISAEGLDSVWRQGLRADWLDSETAIDKYLAIAVTTASGMGRRI